MTVWPDSLTIEPIHRACGVVRLPGSKSLSNRALLLAALAQDRTELSGLLDADDTRVMRSALAALGVELSEVGDRLVVAGCAGRFPNRRADLHLGNAGTALRSLTAALAFAGGHYRLDGVARMRERPIADLVDALNALGARIRYAATPRFPPLLIDPAEGISTHEVEVRGDVSSQFLSGLLMAAPLIAPDAGLSIKVQGELISQPYVTMTIGLMARFGVDVARSGAAFLVPRAAYRSPGHYAVEGDASGASYFLALGAIAGGPVRVEGVGRSSVQGDIRFADALASMGARIEMGDDWIESCAPVDGHLRPFDADFNHIPDAAMTLAVVACFARGPSTLRNIGSWRVKETDRIHAMATELRKLGADVAEGADWLRVTPPAVWREATIDTYEDHRMAMCFSLAAAGGLPVHIRDPRCVAKTFPEYFSRLAEVTDSGQRQGAAAGVSDSGQRQRLRQREAATGPLIPVPVVAIDGPTASGKGTVAQRVAAGLGFHYLDSGSLYRLVALIALRGKVPADDAAQLAHIAATIQPRFAGGGVTLDGADVSDALRSEEVSRAASLVAVHPSVRQALLQLQRGRRVAPGLVADGRDMGTVVFPDAGLKVYLTASPAARAERRYKQLIDKGFPAKLAALVEDLQARDQRDSERAASPLKTAQDAYQLDSSGLSIDEVVAQILRWYADKSARP